MCPTFMGASSGESTLQSCANVRSVVRPTSPKVSSAAAKASAEPVATTHSLSTGAGGGAATPAAAAAIRARRKHAHTSSASEATKPAEMQACCAWRAARRRVRRALWRALERGLERGPERGPERARSGGPRTAHHSRVHGRAADRNEALRARGVGAGEHVDLSADEVPEARELPRGDLVRKEGRLGHRDRAPVQPAEGERDEVFGVAAVAPRVDDPVHVLAELAAAIHQRAAPAVAGPVVRVVEARGGCHTPDHPEVRRPCATGTGAQA